MATVETEHGSLSAYEGARSTTEGRAPHPGRTLNWPSVDIWNPFPENISWGPSGRSSYRPISRGTPWRRSASALALARATGASVTVLHVARPPAVVVDGGRLSAATTAGESNDLWADLRKIKAEEPGVIVEHEVIVADRPDVAHVLKIVESAGCDLIVMGTHGLTGLKHRLFGGLTEEVVRRGPVSRDGGEGPR